MYQYLLYSPAQLASSPRKFPSWRGFGRLAVKSSSGATRWSPGPWYRGLVQLSRPVLYVDMVYCCEFVSFIIYKSQVLMSYTSKRGINMSIRHFSLLTTEALQNFCNWIYTTKQGAISQSCGRVATTSSRSKKGYRSLASFKQLICMTKQERL